MSSLYHTVTKAAFVLERQRLLHDGPVMNILRIIWKHQWVDFFHGQSRSIRVKGERDSAAPQVFTLRLLFFISHHSATSLLKVLPQGFVHFWTQQSVTAKLSAGDAPACRSTLQGTSKKKPKKTNYYRACGLHFCLHHSCCPSRKKRESFYSLLFPPFSSFKSAISFFFFFHLSYLMRGQSTTMNDGVYNL